MLKKNLETYSRNIFTELGKNYAVCTAGDKKIGFNCLTVSWGGIGVLLGKNVAYIFVRKSRYTYGFMQKSDSITLSFLSEAYKDAVSILGTTSGRETDKMQLAKLNYTYDPDFDGAYIEQASYCFKMKKLYAVDLPYEMLPKNLMDQYYPSGDMHTMYVCEIKQYLVKEEEDAIY